MLGNRVDRKNDMIHVCLNNTEYSLEKGSETNASDPRFRH